MTPERRARLLRIVVEFLLAEMAREAAERGGRSGVRGTGSAHTDSPEVEQ